MLSHALLVCALRSLPSKFIWRFNSFWKYPRPPRFLQHLYLTRSLRVFVSFWLPCWRQQNQEPLAQYKEAMLDADGWRRPSGSFFQPQPLSLQILLSELGSGRKFLTKATSFSLLREWKSWTLVRGQTGWYKTVLGERSCGMFCPPLSFPAWTLCFLEVFTGKKHQIHREQKIYPAPQKHYIHRTILGQLSFGSLHSSHVIHCASRNYTWTA